MTKSKLILDSQSAKFNITIVTKDRKDLLKKLLEIGKNMEINVKKTSAIFNPLTQKSKISFSFNINDLQKFLEQIIEKTSRKK
ncbi:hypothetical protein IT413_06545 [Candidatus Peregrinibacteria bacterium]|nr:hypothetical protein [Candidatus Peregrinibacteria bacterium]